MKLTDFMKIKWQDFEEYIELEVPEEFSFEQCMVYLNRSDLECLHKVEAGELYKLLKLDGSNVVVKISMLNKKLLIAFQNKVPTRRGREQAAEYIWSMFDLGTDLTDFYKLAERDSIAKLLIDRYKGLRIVKINDMFEAICWAVMGQQINLRFAYTLKKRFVEAYGEKLVFHNEEYFLFPSAEVISEISIEELKELQFTTRKAEYIFGIAQLFKSGILSKQELEKEEDYLALKKRLVAIKGVGNWTADYAIMKCFSMNNAFPIADVGIHNALKGILGLDQKPEVDYIEKLSVNWKGWEAYVTFYLWRWLYD